MEFTPVSFALKDGRPATLRTLLPEDAEQMLRILRQTAQETHWILCYPEERENMTVEQEEAFLRDRLADPYTLMLTCEVEGRLVGNCEISFGRRIKVSHTATVAIGLLREFWGLGIGTAMFRELIAASRRRPGVIQVVLSFMEGNERGRALYEKMGFRLVGIRPDAFRLRDGTLLDEYEMMLKL